MEKELSRWFLQAYSYYVTHCSARQVMAADNQYASHYVISFKARTSGIRRPSVQDIADSLKQTFGPLCHLIKCEFSIGEVRIGVSEPPAAIRNRIRRVIGRDDELVESVKWNTHTYLACTAFSGIAAVGTASALYMLLTAYNSPFENLIRVATHQLGLN
jgi:hypothetical protein